MTNTITVSGSGSVSEAPDTLTLDLGVSVLAASVGGAAADAAARAGAVIDALTAGGVEGKDIQTANYSIQPEYDRSSNRQRLVGYRVSNTVAVRIRDIPSAGELIDAAASAGGDAVVVNGLSFEIEDTTALTRLAREAAWNDAADKAGQLAALAGVSLGTAVSISESVGWTPPRPFAVRRAAMDVAMQSTPIEGGEQQVSVNIEVSFGIGEV
jgi:uncharacterized protein